MRVAMPMRALYRRRAAPAAWPLATLLLALALTLGGARGVAADCTGSGVTVSQRYLQSGATTTLTFAGTGLAGAAVALYYDDDCTTQVDGVQYTLDAALQASVAAPASSGGYLCLTPASATATATATLTCVCAFYVSSALTVSPTSGYRYNSVTLTGSSVKRNGQAFLSASSRCLSPLSEVLSLTSALVTFTLTVPQGSYYWCSLLTDSAGDPNGEVYMPAASVFVVHAYSLQPRATYSGRSSALTLYEDAAPAAGSYQVALASDEGCTNLEYGYVSSPTFSIAAAGTYYPCVQSTADTTGKVLRGSPLVVTPLPALAYSRSPGVAGMAVRVSVTRNGADGVMTVGMASASSGATAADLLVSATTTATDADADAVVLRVPIGTPSSMYMYVSSPVAASSASGDGSDGIAVTLLFAVGPYFVHAYAPSYGALIANTSVSFGLDSAVAFSAGTVLRFAPASAGGCDAASLTGGALQFTAGPSTTALSPVVLTSAGQWLLCVQEPDILTGTLSPLLNGFDVYAPATVTPSSMLPDIPAELTVSLLPASASVTVISGSTCDGTSSTSSGGEGGSERGSPTMLGSALADASGTARLWITASAGRPPRVCAMYPTMSDGTVGSQVRLVGSIVSSAPRITSTGSVTAGVATVLSFTSVDASLLDGSTALLFAKSKNSGSGSSGDDGVGVDCTTVTTSTTGAAYSLPITVGEAASGAAYCVLTAAPSDTDASYTVCVGGNGHYTSAGSLTVLGVLRAETAPANATAGLPFRLVLTGRTVSVPDPVAFALISAAQPCTDTLAGVQPYTTGSIGADMTTATITDVAADVTSANLCVRSSTGSYVGAGSVALHPLTARAHYAVVGANNSLHAWPSNSATGAGDGDSSCAADFLAPCVGSECTAANAASTCTSARVVFTTSASQELSSSAAAGTYLVCRRCRAGLVSVVVGSNTTVEVLTTVPVTVNDAAAPSAIQQGVPLRITVENSSRGGVDVSSAAVLRVQPSITPCDSTARVSQEVLMDVGTPVNLTVTNLTAAAEVRFCLLVGDYDILPLFTAELRVYATPAAIVDGEAADFRIASGGTLGGAEALLSSTADCASVISTGGSAQTVQNASVSLAVDACAAGIDADHVFFCDRPNSSADLVNRGLVGLLRRASCDRTAAAASIVNVTTAPNAAMDDLGLNSPFLSTPRLARSASCSADSLLASDVTTTGYAPHAGEQANFFVCTDVLHGGAAAFTTAVPTLTVANWAVTPSAVVSRLNAITGAATSAQLTINYPAPGSTAFLSANAQCTTSLRAANGLTTAQLSTSVSLVGTRGLVYVCTPVTGAVAQFLTVTPPVVTAVDNAVFIGFSFRATLAVDAADGQAPLYSMVAGTDSSYAYAAYFTTSGRAVYFSSDGCATLLAGTAAADVHADNTTTLATTSVAAPATGSVALCAQTAAGPATLLPSVAVAVGNVYPTVLVGGTSATMRVPQLPLTTFYLLPAASGCGAAAAGTAALPSFVTDGNGYGVVPLHTVSSGNYTLCYDAGTVVPTADAVLRAAAAELTALPDDLQVVAPSYYDLRGVLFVSGVPGDAMLLEDLDTSHLYQGFARSRDCTVIDEAVGSWEAVGSKSIRVTATAAASDVYLCAWTPVNGSVVALPISSSSSSNSSSSRALAFVAANAGLSSANSLDACTAHTFTSCTAPGESAPSDAVLGVVDGACCNLSAQVNALTQTAMAPAACTLPAAGAALSLHPAGSTFSLCAWSPSDGAYCATLGTVTYTGTCAASHHSSLSGGAIAGIVVGCVVGVLVIAAVVVSVWLCCCRRAYGSDGTQTMAQARHEKKTQLQQQQEQQQQQRMDDADTSAAGSERWASFASGSNPLLAEKAREREKGTQLAAREQPYVAHDREEYSIYADTEESDRSFAADSASDASGSPTVYAAAADRADSGATSGSDRYPERGRSNSLASRGPVGQEHSWDMRSAADLLSGGAATKEAPPVGRAAQELRSSSNSVGSPFVFSMYGAAPHDTDASTEHHRTEGSAPAATVAPSNVARDTSNYDDYLHFADAAEDPPASAPRQRTAARPAANSRDGSPHPSPPRTVPACPPSVRPPPPAPPLDRPPRNKGARNSLQRTGELTVPRGTRELPNILRYVDRTPAVREDGSSAREPLRYAHAAMSVESSVPSMPMKCSRSPLAPSLTRDEDLTETLRSSAAADTMESAVANARAGSEAAPACSNTLPPHSFMAQPLSSAEEREEERREKYRRRAARP